MTIHNEQECCLSKNLEEIWRLAYSHAMQDERITADVQRARTLEFKDITGGFYSGVCVGNLRRRV